MNNTGGVFHLGEQGWGMAHGDRWCITVESLTERYKQGRVDTIRTIELDAGSSWPVYIGVESWLERQQTVDRNERATF